MTPSMMPRTGMGRSGSSTRSTLGLAEQVTALELDILGRAYPRDPMDARLNRLEAQTFPREKPRTDMPLPDRVNRLLAVYPQSPQQISQRTRTQVPDFDQIDATTGAITPSSQQTQQKSGGLGKIINSIGNFISGGSMGGPSSSTYITDPRTGMMIDTISGNIIDPNTGQVIGNRGGSMYSPGYSSGLGTTGGFGTFNNGFSPFGSSYMGGPYGSGYGSGLRFGFGGGRMGGMWP
jgi:hypothetical protein